MRARAFYSLPILFCTVHTLADTTAVRRDAHSLTISATAPTVAITPRSLGGRSVRLPALRYVFRLRTDCAEPFRASSVSLTVADSRRFLDAEELQAGPTPSELVLTVPANQIPPVSVTNFCVVPSASENGSPVDDASRSESVTLPAALSASASLLCVENGKQEILYTSTALDVNLTCELSDGPEEE